MVRERDAAVGAAKLEVKVEERLTLRDGRDEADLLEKVVGALVLV